MSYTTYSQLSVIQKINFKTWCIHYTNKHYGGRFSPNWTPMSVDGIVMNLKLMPFQYTAPYSIKNIQYGK